MVFPIVGGNQSTGDFVTNSLRLNDDDSPSLSLDLSSPNTDKFTISFWVKLTGARSYVASLGKRLTGETGGTMDSGWKTYRASVRTKCNSMQTQIDNASDVDALAALFTYTEQGDGSFTRPLGEFPVKA